ncbi:MAG TPA: hypothetical protein VMV49_04140 [Candidatus Deferrimicrobium sp.]|nr:hypothetical protein [Candidatus Deferrimicrobium sp.]
MNAKFHLRIASEWNAVYKKKIELKLDNPVQETPGIIEPLLKDYKGIEMRFQNKDNGVYLEFNIGTGINKSIASIFIAPDSQNSTNMILEVTALGESAKPSESADVAKKVDLLIEDILFHILQGIKIKDKAKTIEKGKICVKCNKTNDINSKFCNECGFNFTEKLSFTDESPQKPALESPRQPSKAPIQLNPQKEEVLSEADLIKQLDSKYPNQYECALCEMKCAYKNPFLLLLNDLHNLQEPFKKFDGFLNNKDLGVFSDYIYDYTTDKLKKHSQFSKTEINHIAYCIFSILSFHILEKADKKIRLTFAEKIKERLNIRFEKEFPPLSSASALETGTDAAFPTIKTGSLLIEENRCPYCYKKFDERILKLKIKGYPVECPVCGHDL